jgi:eukaryotic-like serine/threonine-protein kinase
MTIQPEPFLDVATSISDGARVDWTVLGASADLSNDPGLLRELEVIARIASAHREAAAQQQPTTPDQPTVPDGKRWGQLIVGDVLGAGSFGTVYRAHDPHLQRDVALKLYKSATIADARLTTLRTEGRLLARVRHSNVVVVHGIEEHGGEVGMWQELIDGRTLADEVRQGGPLGFREAGLVGQDLCRALAAVHLAGLVHRDVKPQNVMRERGGRIVLMDFGLGSDLQHGTTSDVRGTPLYMAPELFTGASASASTDIYSVGVTLFYLVTGSHPVNASTRTDLEKAHHDGTRRLLRDVRPDLPDAFAQVVERACAPDPSARYATVGELQSALSNAIGVTPDSSGTRTSTASSSGGRRAVRWLAAAALLITVLGVAWTMTRTARVPPSGASLSSGDGTGPVGPVVDPTKYEVQATFHRTLASGSEVLTPGVRIAPGDRLFLNLRATKPIHVYIVNQDERGESYLLFPLPGQPVGNPLPASETHRLPSTVDWEVSSVGGREHFLLIASPEPLATFEKIFAALPRPQVGQSPQSAAALTREVVGQLRGIGGLAPRSNATTPAGDVLQTATRLSSGPELVSGPWIRQITFENPSR